MIGFSVLRRREERLELSLFPHAPGKGYVKTQTQQAGGDLQARSRDLTKT